MGISPLSIKEVDARPHDTHATVVGLNPATKAPATTTEGILKPSSNSARFLPSQRYDPSRSYTIRFNTRGGSPVSDFTQPAGTPLTPPAEPIKEGYTFGGWYETEWFIKPYDFTVMPSYNLTLYAKWDLIHTTLTFNTAGGTPMQPITQVYGEAIDMPPPPTKEGYLFHGYSQPIPSTMPAVDTVIDVYWLRETYEICETLSVEAEGLLAAVSPHLPNAGSVEVILSVQPMLPTQPSHETLEQLADMITRHDRLVFYDIEVRMQEEGHEAKLLDELSQPIHLRLTLPKALQGFQTYRVVRVHQGEVDVLETFFDEATQTLTFETTRFSTYVLVYDARGASWIWWVLLLVPIPLLYLSVRYETEILAVFDKRKRPLKKRS